MSLQAIVKDELCVGCGICVSENKDNTFQMGWDDNGFLVPKNLDENIVYEGIKICPFNPNPDKEVENEDKLASIFLNTAIQQDEKIGRFVNTYVGYSNEYRVTSSSGGLATYVFEQLLRDKIVDHLYIVKEVNGSYAYQLFSNIDDIKQISKTRYLPVTLENLFSNINKIDGTIAISGVACFIKAIRLKQFYNPELKDKIPFLIGIICGGLKSEFFTEYLAQKAGILGKYSKQEYRIKNPDSTASDYSFGAYNESKEFKELKMSSVGDMWGSGLFKSNACDFCDDVTTELADISLGDAWLNPYSKEGLGTSVIVTRSKVADTIILKGIEKQKLSVKLLDLSIFKSSQQGSFNHRHDGLKYRIQQRKKQGKLTPLKRSRFLITIPFYFKFVQTQRMSIRAASLNDWRNNRNSEKFDLLINPEKQKLINKTIFYHRMKRLKNILFK